MDFASRGTNETGCQIPNLACLQQCNAVLWLLSANKIHQAKDVIPLPLMSLLFDKGKGDRLHHGRIITRNSVIFHYGSNFL